jgi:hypothetical protein
MEICISHILNSVNSLILFKVSKAQFCCNESDQQNALYRLWQASQLSFSYGISYSKKEVSLPHPVFLSLSFFLAEKACLSVNIWRVHPVAVCHKQNNHLASTVTIYSLAASTVTIYSLACNYLPISLHVSADLAIIRRMGLSYTTLNCRRQKYTSWINGVLYRELTIMCPKIWFSHLAYHMTLYKFNFSDLYFYILYIVATHISCVLYNIHLMIARSAETCSEMGR